VRQATAADLDEIHAIIQAGLGTTLMRFAEQQARQRHLPRLTLYTHEVMTENQAIYAHLGYREIERRSEDGYRRIYMEKILPDPNPDPDPAQDSSAGGATS
jgi:N-acetylglutamate synthase-like GNAT family acetyltransferase